MHTNNPPTNIATTPPGGEDLHHKKDADHPGYETTDVNVGGVAVFLAGLLGFVVVFFFFCFGMGKLINTEFAKEDGPVDKWHHPGIFAGAANNGGKREDLTSNADLQQHELNQMTATFPTPRLEADDGNQDTADLHAREDLLLDHYSSVPGQTGIRIPIDRAMELIAQKGLPVAPAVQTEQLAGDSTPKVQVPLTTGFARTGYELGTIEAREQKMSKGGAEK